MNDNLEIFKALGDKTRLGIVKVLSQKTFCLEELSERFELTPATLSFHMKKLEAAGLVTKSRDQYFTNFSIIPEIYDKKLKELLAFESALPDKEDSFKKKVVGSFMNRGKIVQLPRQHKKRLILLEEITKHFNPDKIYTEKEVDKIIGNIFPDYCTLRRMLIDERYMERKNGQYTIINQKENVMDMEIEKQKSASERKRELKLEYKEKKFLMGIYKIVNNANGKIYIGGSQNIPGRFNRHEFLLKMGLHLNKELQSDWNEFGKDNFTFELLEELKDPDDSMQYNNRQLDKMKMMWLEKLQPFDEKGYNKKSFKTQ